VFSTTEGARHSEEKLGATECESGNVEVQWTVPGNVCYRL
jgi:hypothetical protein